MNYKSLFGYLKGSMVIIHELMKTYIPILGYPKGVTLKYLMSTAGQGLWMRLIAGYLLGEGGRGYLARVLMDRLAGP